MVLPFSSLFVALSSTHSVLCFVLTHIVAQPTRQSELDNSPLHHSGRNEALLFGWCLPSPCIVTQLTLDLQGEFPAASRSAWLHFTAREIDFNPVLGELYSSKM